MSFQDRKEIRAHREPWLFDTIALRIAVVSEMSGKRTVALAQPLTLKQLNPEDMCLEHEPTLRIEPSEAQQFMDELWRVGIRPTEGAGSVGQLAATEKHLEDMRRLALAATPSLAK